MTDDPGSNAATYLLRAHRAVGEGMPAVIITVVLGEAIGAKVLVISGEIEGSLGSTEWDQRALALASDALSSEQGGLVALDSETDVFVDVFPLPSLLVIIGAVHVAQALVRLAQPLGFRIAVADARAALATPERFPTVDDLIVAWPDEAFGQLPITRTSAIVILTHDPKFDEPAILGALQTEAGYIGAVGSRKTNLERRERLREAGATDEQIDRVHGPIGLNIGGRTPEEMAISILAEIIAVRNGRPGGFLNQASGSIRAGSG